MALMEKLNASARALAEEVAKGDEMDRGRLAKLLKDHADILASDEAKGYAGLPELTRQIEQLRKDVDENAKMSREARDLGLRVRDSRVQVPGGREARQELLRDNRAFYSDDMAERFGAAITVQLCPPGKALENWAPKRTREIADDVFKQAGAHQKLGDIGPDISGHGTELISPEFRAELIRGVEAEGTLFPECRRVPLATMGATTWPKLTGGFTGYWTAAGTEILRSALTFTTVTMTPAKRAILTVIDNEMFRDPTLLVALGQLAGVEMIRSMAMCLDDTLINGDGTADYGGFTGILQSATIAPVNAAAHTTGATIDGTDIGLVVAGLPVAYALGNARWALSLGMRGVLRNLKSTTGVPIYDRGDGREPSTIDGYPYVLSTRMPSVASATTDMPYAIFGDFRLGFYVGMLGNIRIDNSDQALYLSDQTAIRGIMHVAIAEADADALVIAETH